MNDGTGRRNGGFALKSWHLILALLVLVVGLITLHVTLRQNSLKRRLAGLRAAGYPTSFAELEEQTRLPEGAPNGAEAYLRAFAAYVPPVNEVTVPIVGKAPSLDRGVPLSEPATKAISKCLADNQRCLSLLHEAAGFKDSRYGWTAKDYASPLTELGDLRLSARLLQLAAIFHAHQGDPNAAVTCVKDGLRLADSLGRELMLISYLVRVACTAVALGGLEQSLSVTTFTDAQLQELHAALTAADATLDFTQTLVAERCCMLENCRNPSLMGGSGVNIPIHILPGVRGRGLIDTLDYMEDCIAASKLPPAERLAKFRAAGKHVDDLSIFHVMIKIVAPSLSRIGELDLRLRAHLDLARTALALERYRLATGRLPEQLEDLVPQYLAQVPIDPFDGQPLRYQRREPGYLLYSVFEDGQDNGGKEKADVDRGDPHDWCFRVTR